MAIRASRASSVVTEWVSVGTGKSSATWTVSTPWPLERCALDATIPRTPRRRPGRQHQSLIRHHDHRCEGRTSLGRCHRHCRRAPGLPPTKERRGCWTANWSSSSAATQFRSVAATHGRSRAAGSRRDTINQRWLTRDFEGSSSLLSAPGGCLQPTARFCVGSVGRVDASRRTVRWAVIR